MITRRRVFTRFSLIVAVVFGSSVLLVSTDWTKLSLHDADAARRDSEVIGVTVDRRVNATPNASCREPTLTYPPYKSPQGQTRPASYESLLCESKHFYDDEDVQSLRTQSKSEPSSEKFNIFIFPVESLTMQAFHSDMPKTRNVLEGASAVFFANFHHRSGNTRANLVPMLLGELVDYRLVSERNNITCVFNLTEESLLERSLWHIASKHEYATVQGGTACNAFVGCNRLSTSDGYIFHDNLKRRTDFDYSFPYGAFYASHRAERCTNYVEAKTVEDVLRCASEGPYSEKFLNYYKKLRKKNEGVLTFTVAQLEEPHGNKMYWPVDAIVADFLKWIIDEDDTLLVFLGDHGDASGTPLAIVPPSSVDVAFDPLRYLASSMIVHDNIYDFLQRYLRSGDISESIRLLAETLQTNQCSQYKNLDVCFCEESRSVEEKTRVVHFDKSLQEKVVLYIRSQTKASACAAYEVAEVSNIRTEYGNLKFDIRFINGSIYIARFTTSADFSVAQLTRYHTQTPCTPKGVHPEFCVCDEHSFRKSNE